MSGSLMIASVLARLLNTNGDAANARVLARRAGWAGIHADVVDVDAPGTFPRDVHVVVVGSCGDGERPAAISALQSVAVELRRAVDAGVPLLAVGVGWELLSRTFEYADGRRADGLGLFPGHAVRRPARVSDDLVVDSAFGRLVGYENHSSDYRIDGNHSPLGRVVYGSGNGAQTTVTSGSDSADDATRGEGLLIGSLIGTHLHGPVLAKNPQLADHLLRLALQYRDPDHGLPEPAPGSQASEADAIAAAARHQITDRLGL